MPKMKTHSGAKKRFKLTGSGKVKRGHANMSHLNRRHSARQHNHLAGTGMVDQADEKRIKRLLVG
jgi:large subunit ribosomal protein L35